MALSFTHRFSFVKRVRELKMLQNCPQAMHNYELCRIYNFMFRASIPLELVSDSNWFKSSKLITM
jgi:hypothetical protein